MYALVHSQLADSAQVTAVDLCPTPPLVGTAEYAEDVEAAVPELLVGNAIDHRRPGFYDMIVSDSFLPRFSTNELRTLLAAWCVSLSRGVALTTVRLPRTNREARYERTGRLDRWIQIANDARPWWPDLSDLPFEELVRRISVFIANQERNTTLNLSRLHSLFVEAGFRRPTITTRSYRDREFALVAARKVPA